MSDFDFDNTDGDSNLDYSVNNNNPNQARRQDINFYNYAPQEPAQLEFQEIEDEGEGPPTLPSDKHNLEDFFTEDVTIKNEDEDEDPQLEIGGTKFWKLAFYRTVYNVDTVEVLKRISKTFNPFGTSFFEHVGNNPDLYGWIWISITLAFIIAASGNITSYISFIVENGDDPTKSWSYDFTYLTFGTVFIIVYVTVIPLLVWVSLFLWLKIKLNLIQNICIIGYSLFPYIISALLMTVPFFLLQLGATIVACLIVCIFLARNYFPYIKEIPMGGGITLVSLILCNVFFAFVLQLFFFSSMSMMDLEFLFANNSTTSSVSPTQTYTISPSLSMSTSITPSFSISPIPSPSPSMSIAITPSSLTNSTLSLISHY